MSWSSAHEQLVVQLVQKLVGSSDTPAPYRDAARRTAALPVHCDMGGCLAITERGEVIEYDAETNTVKPVAEEKWRMLALAKAAKRYDGLRGLTPERPSHANTCSACEGSGEVLDGLDCGECSGLGWLI